MYSSIRLDYYFCIQFHPTFQVDDSYKCLLGEFLVTVSMQSSMYKLCRVLRYSRVNYASEVPYSSTWRLLALGFCIQQGVKTRQKQ